jgi:hypothetical protein
LTGIKRAINGAPGVKLTEKGKSVGWFESLEEAENFLICFRKQVHGEFENHGGAA